MTITTQPSVPLPAGAYSVSDWQDSAPGPLRFFDGRSWVISRRGDRTRDADIDVQICGTQEQDGSVEREIIVHQLHGDYPITAEQARQIAAALIVAADEIDELTAHDHV